MLISFVILACLTAGVGTIAFLKPGNFFYSGLRTAGDQARMLIFRLPFALITAGFLIELMPPELVAEWMGSASGWRGILIASMLGTLMPLGPMVLIPIAVALFAVGAGAPQVIAFISGWSVLAFHRIIVWELPMLGMNLTFVRMVSSLILPPLAGFLAALIALVLGY